ncbi:hypothetical protein [Streptomyces sp. NRRL B-24484]|uniref:hypothetical protein n=1 Tax=Streptomyces sp. NRRL B-24484 TaxID=1463833 RepID=UPI0004C0BF2A|nr:hypothetical protein [Streptomyces sp. NRRL B-24484]
MSLVSRSAGNRAAGDPRTEGLTGGQHFLADPSLLPVLQGRRQRSGGDVRYELLSRHGEDDRPGLTRLTALIEAKVRAGGVDSP